MARAGGGGSSSAPALRGLTCGVLLAKGNEVAWICSIRKQARRESVSLCPPTWQCRLLCRQEVNAKRCSREKRGLEMQGGAWASACHHCCRRRQRNHPNTLPSDLPCAPPPTWHIWDSLTPGPLLGLSCVLKRYMEVLTLSASKCDVAGRQDDCIRN